MARVTLLTDFGTADGYVGAMKGVVASLAPGAHLDDIAHDLRQGDVRTAALTLGRYWRLHPLGTVHLVVVDPGVGTGRAALALEADGRRVVAPDNGIVDRVLAQSSDWRAVRVTEGGPVRPAASRTFHGRDVFAPAAGLLASGAVLESLGPPLSEPVRLSWELPRPVEGGVEGEVRAVDRFGNLQTNIPGERLVPGARVRIGECTVEVAGTYGAVGQGTLLALVDSDGMVEVAVRNGSAARRLGCGPGAPVRVILSEAADPLS